MILKNKSNQTKIPQEPTFTLIQLANHYSDLQLGLTCEPLCTAKLKAIKRLRKIERNPHKTKYQCYCLQDYAIALESLPERHIELMKSIDWISTFYEIPHNDNGFYNESWNPQNILPIGTVMAKYYISFDKYIALLLIEHSSKQSMIGGAK